jgi:FkbM family methyltransferase
MIRRILSSAGYRLTREAASNRFEAMETTLALLRQRGYEPRRIVDGGANVGEWTKIALRIFPSAVVHLIEPQPGCATALRRICNDHPTARYHPVALAAPGVREVAMAGAAPSSASSGAWVARPDEIAGETLICPATTLDELLAPGLARSDRTLLKLDLEGSELQALSGASSTLQAIEVVLTEVQFFEINGNGRPVFADVVEVMRSHSFEVYDVASLSPRPRDMRLRQGDVVFVRRGSELMQDRAWE